MVSKEFGPDRELNPGPPAYAQSILRRFAPEAGIILLDHQADYRMLRMAVLAFNAGAVPQRE